MQVRWRQRLRLCWIPPAMAAAASSPLPTKGSAGCCFLISTMYVARRRALCRGVWNWVLMRPSMAGCIELQNPC
jgi:hypothetical protein